MNNLVVKTNWIPLEYCVQRKWLLKFYVKLSKMIQQMSFKFIGTLLWMANYMLLLRKLFLTCIITRTHEANLHIGIINEVFFQKIWPKWWFISILILHQIISAAPSSILGLLRFRNLPAGRTALSLLSIKMANTYEIHKALYGAGEECPKVLFYV